MLVSRLGCLFVVDYESVGMMLMDPHCLSPCLVEDNLQLEHLTFQKSVSPSVEVEPASSSAMSQQPVISVKGRLRKNAKFWINDLQASEFVSDIVTSGYRLPFLAFPPAVCAYNHKSAFEYSAFVSEAIQELVETGCARVVHDCPVVCSPLQAVVNAKGKCRLVIDLRYINQYLHLSKFKYEGLNLIPMLFKEGDYVFTFDLKSGYHHVDIHNDSQPFLGFSWGKGKDRKFYTFTVLPFGLASACYVFTKLLRPLVKRWRVMGLHVILYIDDGICGAASEEKCLESRKIIVSDLEQAGLVLNIAKSNLEPQQLVEWLGFTVDLQVGCFRVPEDKVSRLKSAIRCISPEMPVHARALASVVGQIISMSVALGPVARLRTRAMYVILNQRRCWSDKLVLSEDASDELRFWFQNVDTFNGQSIWFSAGITRIVYSDASSTGYGGYAVEVGPEFVQGQWSADELVLSSTWRELKAVYNVLKSLAPKLMGHAVKWFSDNQAVVRIVQVGSRKQHLQEGALSIFALCFHHNIKLEMEWVPRSANEIADYISRIRDFDDWMVNPVVFRYLDNMWGPHTVDCFANECNKQLSRFHSRFLCPCTEAVDTFTVNWGNDVCWLVPPTHLVSRVLCHARACNARGTLLVPIWKSAPFWPLLCPDGRHLAPFVHAYHVFPYWVGMLLPGHSGSNIGDSLNSESIMLAVFIDFACPARKCNASYCMFDTTGVCDSCALNWTANN